MASRVIPEVGGFDLRSLSRFVSFEATADGMSVVVYTRCPSARID
jgi:hypothetical protein